MIIPKHIDKFVNETNQDWVFTLCEIVNKQLDESFELFAQEKYSPKIKDELFFHLLFFNSFTDIQMKQVQNKDLFLIGEEDPSGLITDETIEVFVQKNIYEVIIMFMMESASNSKDVFKKLVALKKTERVKYDKRFLKHISDIFESKRDTKIKIDGTEEIYKIENAIIESFKYFPQYKCNKKVDEEIENEFENIYKAVKTYRTRKK